MDVVHGGSRRQNLTAVTRERKGVKVTLSFELGKPARWGGKEKASSFL